jgi:hypothetical protein
MGITQAAPAVGVRLRPGRVARHDGTTSPPSSEGFAQGILRSPPWYTARRGVSALALGRGVRFTVLLPPGVLSTLGV